MAEIVCPKCGTEVEITDFDNTENAQCQLCGKILLAEVLAKKHELEAQGKSLDTESSKESTSQLLEKRFDKIDDEDDLFDDLDPFEIEEDDTETPPDDLMDETDDLEEFDEDLVKTKVDEGEQKKFKNPMEKSKLMKKLKDDQDLFGGLDE